MKKEATRFLSLTESRIELRVFRYFKVSKGTLPYKGTKLNNQFSCAKIKLTTNDFKVHVQQLTNIKYTKQYQRYTTHVVTIQRCWQYSSGRQISYIFL